MAKHIGEPELEIRKIADAVSVPYAKEPQSSYCTKPKLMAQRVWSASSATQPSKTRNNLMVS